MDPAPIPAYLLERLAAGDLPAPDAAALRARLEPERERALRAELAADDAATLLSHPPARVADEVRRRAGVAPGRRRAPLFAALATAGALAVVGLVWRAAAPPPGDGARVKGLAPHLVVHRRLGDGQEVLAAGAAARSGDELQLGYVSAGRPFGVVISIDGRGAATLHLPISGQDAAPLAAAGEALLPASYRLDDAPRFERFFLVTGPRPFAVGPVVAAARALAARPDAATAALPLDRELAASSFLVAKEAR